MLSSRRTFSDIVGERAIEIGSELISSKEEYQKLCDESIHIYQQLLIFLPVEFHSLLSEYEKIHLLLQGVVLDSAYVIGLVDGLSVDSCKPMPNEV